MAATGRAVISFEPVPSNQRLHKLAVCLNGFFNRYTLVLGAVGERDGNVTLHIPDRGWTDNAALSQGASASASSTETCTPARNTSRIALRRPTSKPKPTATCRRQ
jgi:hypothetical protein